MLAGISPVHELPLNLHTAPQHSPPAWCVSLTMCSVRVAACWLACTEICLQVGLHKEMQAAENAHKTITKPMSYLLKPVTLWLQIAGLFSPFDSSACCPADCKPGVGSLAKHQRVTASPRQSQHLQHSEGVPGYGASGPLSRAKSTGSSAPPGSSANPIAQPSIVRRWADQRKEAPWLIWEHGSLCFLTAEKLAGTEAETLQHRLAQQIGLQSPPLACNATAWKSGVCWCTG